MSSSPFKKRTDAEQWNIDRPRIHALKNKVMATQPGYGDDNYRDTVLDVSKGRTDSSKELAPHERLELIDRLAWLAGEHQRLVWQPRNKKSYPGRPKNMDVPDRATMLKKIEACLTGRKLPWAYAESMAKRICKKDALEFCSPDELHKIVKAFGYDARRKGLRK